MALRSISALLFMLSCSPALATRRIGHFFAEPRYSPVQSTTTFTSSAAKPRGAGGGESSSASSADVSPWLEKFVDPLFIPTYIDLSHGNDVTLGAYVTYQKFHRDLPPTRIYAYGTSQATATYPGPVLEASRWTDAHVTWENHIEDKSHMFTVDNTLGGPKLQRGGVPMVVHLHGGETEPKSDGKPDNWFTAFGEVGPTYTTNHYQYNNNKLPTMLWYHDHALGTNLLSLAAGLSGLYIIRDLHGTEKDLDLPHGKYEVPLMISDRIFFDNGSINYPNVGTVPSVHPSWISEYIGDTIVVNGRAWPYMDVDRTAYRLRMAGAGNSRSFNLRFQCVASQDYPDFRTPLHGQVLTFHQIGSDGGYLNSPVPLQSLLLVTAMRVDIVIDFSQVDSSCSDVIMTNDANAPYPGGDPVTAATSLVMKFHLIGDPKPGYTLPQHLGNVPSWEGARLDNVRFIGMTEADDPASGLPTGLLLNNLPYKAPVTETPVYGATELWNFINTTPDMHPMHIHLITARIVKRQHFDVAAYSSGTCSFTDRSKPTCFNGTALPPAPEEQGWVDVYKSYPGMVLTIIARWTQQDGGDFPFDPTGPPGYIYHCHIMEHEANQKMRPITILPKGSPLTSGAWSAGLPRGAAIESYLDGLK